MVLLRINLLLSLRCKKDKKKEKKEKEKKGEESLFCLFRSLLLLFFCRFPKGERAGGEWPGGGRRSWFFGFGFVIVGFLEGTLE